MERKVFQTQFVGKNETRLFCSVYFPVSLGVFEIIKQKRNCEHISGILGCMK